MLSIGFAQEDVTPALGRPVAGTGDERPTETVELPLYARAMTLDDGERRFALVALDLLFLNAVTVAEIRETVAERTGLSPQGVIVACPHTHYAPRTTALHDHEPDHDYLDRIRAAAARTVAAALDGRREARLTFASVSAPGWTFNRRPIYRSGQVGTQGPAYGPDFVALEGPVDDELQLLLASAADDGSPLGGIVNFACHATVRPDGPAKLSADYPGHLTEQLAARLGGGVFLYTAGACGDLWGFDLRRHTPRFEDSMTHLRAMGDALAEAAVEALPRATPLDVPRIRSARRVVRLEQRRPTRRQLELARWYLEQAPDDVDLAALTQEAYGHAHTFYEPTVFHASWFARETIGMWEWQRRVGTRSLREDVEVQALGLGDLAIAMYPVELFAELGIATKQRSPFPHTMVATLANGWHGYAPTVAAFARGGYEPRLGQQSRLEQQAGPKLVDAARVLLSELATR
jgi:neutral ceramidase